ncbi:polyribonucleotide nucleotidyltransferase [Candidatus Daviesbacteria bacterium]|nr:polyribonucleotide nucleotidyltransferase [Candidatus Daviesbacteria bacterium]
MKDKVTAKQKTSFITKEMDLNGRTLKLETGKFALQADAAVLATWGETVVLATVSTQPITEDPGYFPLSVEYVEKHYASGRITPQKFIKREGRPSEKSILSGRAIDRSIRPLFPKDFRDEVQVIVTVLSYDGINDPVELGLIGTAAALSISSVPWAGPISLTRVGELNGEVVINPNLSDFENLNFNLLVASGKDLVTMIEAEAKQVKEEVIFDAIKKAHTASQPVIDLISEFAKAAGKEKQTFVNVAEEIDVKLLTQVRKDIKERIEAALFDKDKTWHDLTGDIIKDEIIALHADTLTAIQVVAVFDKVAKEIMNDTILNKSKRVDGRGMEEVREINMEIGILPRAHGSALFQRGGSQLLSVATLGPLSVGQTLEGMEGESSKRFMHYYNMSINPFASGEVKRIGSPNRRDIGHGNLGEISLESVIPSIQDFPYAIRVVSEVLGANASTSQAAICASTLAMLDAGVPVEPVAGIAMGLITDHNIKKGSGQGFQVITDMQAVEDFYGEMDFKVAGTKNGITGIQMDTKLHGLTFDIIKEALRQGKAAREFILERMAQVMPKEIKISVYAPKIKITHIKPEEIGMLIGPGGKNINGIIAKTGAQIDIEDDGTVMISSTDEESIAKAMEAVEGMFKEVKPGEEFDGKVVRIAPFGAFVEILPGKDGLVHVSQMAPGRVERPEDIVSEGQVVHVRVTDVDPQGKIALSMLFGDDRKVESEGRPSRSSGFGRFDGSSVGRGEGSGYSGGGGRPAGGFQRRGFGGGRPGGSGFRDRGRGGFGGNDRGFSPRGSTRGRPGRRDFGR